MSDAVEIFLDDLKCELQRFNPKPGDVFVLTVPGELQEIEINRIKNSWKARLPNNPVVVVCNFVGLKVNLEEAKA